MDPNKDSASVKNPIKLEREGEKNRNCRNPPRQASTSDNGENVFTSGSSQSSNSIPLNGPRALHTNSLPSTESGHQSNRPNDAISESQNYQYGTSQSHISHRAINYYIDDIEPVAGCSNATNNTCENGSEPIPDVLTCQRHKARIDRAGSSSAPSTSGTSRACDPSDNNARENRKRPSSLKLNRPNLDAEDSSSDTGNDDYSLGSEDGCIYTYRGGEHLADLPSSFFSLDMGLPIDMHMMMLPNFQGQQQGAVARDQDSRASSPDMDFLEMDFDPGPSCEVDTGDESSPDADVDAVSNMPDENEPVPLRAVSPENVEGAEFNPICIPAPSGLQGVHNAPNVPSTSRSVDQSQGDCKHEPDNACGPYITHVNIRGEQLIVRRTMSYGPVHEPDSLHISSGDLVSPREMMNYDEEHAEGAFAYQINQGERLTFDSGNLSSALYHLTMAKKLMAENAKSDAERHDSEPAGQQAVPGISDRPTASTSVSGSGYAEVPRSMVWSEREACERQVTQIATSACGATAVVNVFIALGVPVNIEKINTAVGTRQRANNAPLPRYLLSRAVAGCTAADLVSGIQRASDGLVTARFFPTYPERAVSLSHWLADWISLGAVPILTLNLQVGCEGDIPDAWHHQMVFGVSSSGVFLCNPVECVSETALWPRLTSPSILLVRTRDVLSRFTTSTDLTPLMYVPDRRFHTHNVLGQVVNVIREWRSGGCPKHTRTRTRHVRLPCAYQAGVTVAALTGSEAHRRLMHAPQLPILSILPIPPIPPIQPTQPIQPPTPPSPGDDCL